MSVASAAPGESQRIPQNNKIVADVGELPNKLPKTKLELTSKRTKYSTRYLNPDGSFTEEIYLEPQFYQDPTDKKWLSIDNKIKSSTKNVGKYENTANDFKVSLTDQTGSGDLVSVEKDNKSITLIPVNAQKVKATTKGNEITYPSLFINADVRYTVQGDGVKEDIILQRYSNQNVFSFELKLTGLTPEAEEDGTITFSDNKGIKQWFLEKPFMTDANGKYSDNVILELREQNRKTYVDVIADQTFLNDSETEYPVTIDPTINNWEVLRDAFVSSAFPTSSYSSNISMYTGNDSGYFGATRSLLQFYLPSLPSDSKISSANVNVYQTRNETTNVSVDANRITGSWGTVTWNTQPAINATPEKTVTSNAVNAYWQWDITQLTKDWYNGVLPNYGIMLKQQNESTSPFRAFNTVNSGTNTPRLTLNYTVDAIGLENFWGYTPDGVNPSNGNLVYQETDLNISGRGIPVNMTRTYNSRKSSVAGMFGFGWWSNTDTRLVDTGSGPITLIDGDSTRHIFGQIAGGGYVAHGGVYLTLVKNADSTYTITQTDGTKLNFNTSGKISSLIDTNGNTTTYTYSSGKLTSVQDASGRTTSITYGTNGYVSVITDPANRTVSYAYDTSGNLTKVTDAAGKFTTFAYGTTHNLTGITNARNITTTITYDASNRVTSISQPITIDGVATTSTTTYSYDTTNLVTTVTGGEARRVDYTYSSNGNVVQITENPLDAANKAITTFTYDNNNNLTQVKDPNTNKVSGTSAYIYTYDTKGNITAVQLPENQTAFNTYDSQNNLIKEQDFNSNISSNDYDAKNNQTESTDPTVATAANRYDARGNLLYFTNPMSAADNQVANSSFELDENADNWPDNWNQAIEPGKTATFGWSTAAKFGAKAVSISNPTGWAIVGSDMFSYVTGQKYTVSGYVKTTGITNTAIVKLEFFNSSNGWLGQQAAYQLTGTHDWTRIQTVVDSVPPNTAKVKVSVGLNAGSGAAYFDGIQFEKGTTLSAYNLVDNASFERNAGTGSIPANWTTSGNLSASDGTDPLNQSLDNVYAGGYSLKMTGEQGKNKYIKQRINISGDASSLYTLSGWSKQSGANQTGGYYHLQVAINHTDGTTDWNNANAFSKTDTDWQHVAAQVKPTKAFNSIDVYYYYYDQLGTAWFDAMRLETGNSHTFNTYDTNGNYLTSVDNPVGNNVSFTYDSVGNQTKITDGKGQNTSFTYDGRNLLTKVTDPKLKETMYEYDGVGNRTKVTDAKNNATTFGYNEFNKVSSTTNPLNQTIQYGYDKNGNSTKIIFPKGDTVSYSFNALNRMTSISNNGAAKWNFAYDANGNLTSATDATGKSTTYTYNGNNQITQQAEGASNKIDYVYEIDKINLSSFTVTAGTASFSTGLSYNPLDQLVALSRNGVNQAKFVYDERGNLISVTYSNGTYVLYEIDEADRLISVKNYNAVGALRDSNSYTYDVNGNRTSVKTGSGTISYQYDELNQLTQETLLDGTAIAYEYDVVGNRTKKTVTQGGTPITTNYTYDAGNQLTTVNGQAYTYDANGNLTGNGSKTFIYDEENHLIEVKNSVGTSLAKYAYDHGGKRISMTTSSGTIFYHYSNDKVIYETDSNNNIISEYSWDGQGNPVSMTKNGNTYFYHINGHGDITSLTDVSGATVAQYQYDAWGSIISQTGTMATSNPYRYAGYRYDEVTKLYYLMARYYNTETGRFITKDTFLGFEDEPLSLNQYLYTHNNPIMYYDSDGHRFGPIIKIIKKIFKKNPTTAIKRLKPTEIQKAVSDPSRLQHSFKHAKDVGFAGKNWNNATKELFKEMIVDVLTNFTHTIGGELGGVPVKGYYKKANNNDVLVWVFLDGNYKGLVATVVKPFPSQLKGMGVIK